jgi:hypothetical protein
MDMMQEIGELIDSAKSMIIRDIRLRDEEGVEFDTAGPAIGVLKKSLFIPNWILCYPHLHSLHYTICLYLLPLKLLNTESDLRLRDGEKQKFARRNGGTNK